MANNTETLGLFKNNTWNHQPIADRLNQSVFDGTDRLKLVFAEQDAIKDRKSDEYKALDKEANRIMFEGEDAMRKLGKLPLGAEHFTPKIKQTA
ncbi:MAG: hypothetical protein JKY80_09425 [Mariprofundaceae bacterium]|nr:hypothetical protein [Mariprofundaceae bacterium]